ncbi:glycosyl hydrolase 5 family protein-like [Pistacia vera]|uniref:glycosyl hydrolase 5 family protein-like n=1 Tax=Pistacia vera TaxID=55513 RepID=UPI001262BAAC|nr:glycosyl hydrolase 5 family protein-like [Pistacia vera]
MEKMLLKTLQAIFLFSLLYFAIPSFSYPLSTRGRWIIDEETGQRVKLSCVNWASHLEPMIAEGLDKQPLSKIVAQIVQNKFNCVRLTWPTFLFTREIFGSRTVTYSFDSLDLNEAKAGFAKNNPALLNMTVIQVYDAVVDELGAQGVMVLLDNHVSQPKWCCNNDDGNGFFGDTHFNPDEWVKGLVTVATHFKHRKQVVSISTRNEPHGARENENDWLKYIGIGAIMIHRANPHVLVPVSGIKYSRDFSFLKEKPFLSNNLDNKLVYEAHWYKFSEEHSDIWDVQPLNRVCAESSLYMMDHSAFLTDGDNPVPLFLGEFGLNQQDLTDSERRYMSCIKAFIAERDFDWGLWALQGGYYLREGKTGTEETFGVLNGNWDQLRNPKFIESLHFLQGKIQDPFSNQSTSYVMYHPLSGNPVHVNGKNELYVTNSSVWSRWSHDGNGTPIRLMDSAQCLKVVGDGLEPILSTDCSTQQSAWSEVSHSKLQLAAKDVNGDLLCLDKKSPDSSQILTTKCICIEDDDSSCLDDPQSQWFKLSRTNIK